MNLQLRAGTPNDDNREYVPLGIKETDMTVNENGNNSQVYPANLKEFSGILVAGAVHGHLMPLLYDGPHQRQIILIDVLRADKEGRGDLLLRQNFQQRHRVGAGAVVKGQADPLCLRGLGCGDRKAVVGDRRFRRLPMVEQVQHDRQNHGQQPQHQICQHLLVLFLPAFVAANGARPLPCCLLQRMRRTAPVKPRRGIQKARGLPCGTPRGI